MRKPFHYFFSILLYAFFTLPTNAIPRADKIQYHQYFPQASSLFWLRHNFANSLKNSFVSTKHSIVPPLHNSSQAQVNVYMPALFNSQVFEQGAAEGMVEDLFRWQYYVLAAYYAVFQFIVELNPFPDISYILKAQNPGYPYSPSLLYRALFIQLGTNPYYEDLKSRFGKLPYLSYGLGFTFSFN